MTGTEARFIDVNGAGLRYVLTGAGPKPLVLVHEMGGTLESWAEVVPALAPGRLVLRYDTRGAGMSEKARGTLSIDTMVEDLAALLDALAMPGPVTLAGCAVGAGIALHFTARFPTRVRALIAMAPATGVAAAGRAATLARIDHGEQAGMRAIAQDSFAGSYPPELRQDSARFEAFRARWLGNDPGSYAAIYRMLVGMDLTPELPTIACPTLVLAGTHDRLRPPEIVAPIARLIPGAAFAALPTGHFMAVQTPQLVADAMAQFLASVDA